MKTYKIPNLHAIQVIYCPPTNSRGSRVKIKSDRFMTSLYIPYNHEGDTLSSAVDYLIEKGFTIVGKAESEKGYILLSNTFLNIK